MMQLRGVGRRFQVGGQVVQALRDIHLEIGAGEHLAVTGPSGSGKSTLLYVLGLLDRPSSGHYLLEGRDVTELDDAQAARVRSEKIGFVFQFFHLVPRLTAAENVALPLLLVDADPGERNRRVAAALESVGLTPRARHRPEELSGGERQRVALARATIMDPAVILADEPTGNLDRRSGEDVLRILDGFHARGKSVIVVTHDPAVAERAPRRLRMVDGAIESDTTS
jgi:putative ABC transport system ATP-binding protein